MSPLLAAAGAPVGAMDVVHAVTLGLLALAGALIVVRLLRGPTMHDRVIALDTLVVVVVMGIAVGTAWRGDGVDATLLIVVALLGFLGTVAVVRVLGDGS